jgi:hypothetical protein
MFAKLWHKFKTAPRHWQLLISAQLIFTVGGMSHRIEKMLGNEEESKPPRYMSDRDREHAESQRLRETKKE